MLVDRDHPGLVATSRKNWRALVAGKLTLRVAPLTATGLMVSFWFYESPSAMSLGALRQRRPHRCWVTFW